MKLYDLERKSHGISIRSRQSSFILFSLTFFSMIACKPRAIDLDSEELGSKSGIEALANLKLPIEAAHLGSVDKLHPMDAFASKTELDSLIQELWKAFSGESKELRFFHCEGRSFYPETTTVKECSNVLKLPNVRFQFTFKSYNSKKHSKCLLNQEGCKIHQAITVIDIGNNGLQRPPVFISKDPMPELAILLTNRVAVSNKKGITDFIGRFAEKDTFATMTIAPYNISKQLGLELGSVFGECNKQVMNLVDFSNRAIKHYDAHRRPVILTSIAAEGVMNWMTAGLAFTAIRFTVKMRMGGQLASRFAARYGKYQFFNQGASLLTVPNSINGMVNLKSNLERMKPGSVEERATSQAILLSDSLAMFGGTLFSGKIAVKHWKTAAAVMTSLALTGGSKVCTSKGEKNCDARVFIKSEDISKLADRIRSGNGSEVASSLCQMQKKAGLRSDCPPPPKEDVFKCK